MKAFEARKASVQPQFEKAMEDIEQAIGWGWKSTHVCHGHALYPEVAEMIAKEGYDVKIVLRANDIMSYSEVSWEYAEEGKEGTVTYVDETKPKPELHIPGFEKFRSGIFDINREEMDIDETNESEPAEENDAVQTDDEC